MFRVVVLLCIPAVVSGCSPLPPGQEVRVNFLVDGMIQIPQEFAYSLDYTKVLPKYPKFAKSTTEAITNIQNYVKSAVTAAIREEARKAGIEGLVVDIANQVKPTVYYNPMNCSNAAEKAEAPTAGTPGYSCIVKPDIVTHVAYDATTPAEIPYAYQQFMISLSVMVITDFQFRPCRMEQRYVGADIVEGAASAEGFNLRLVLQNCILDPHMIKDSFVGNCK